MLGREECYAVQQCRCPRGAALNRPKSRALSAKEAKRILETTQHSVNTELSGVTLSRVSGSNKERSAIRHFTWTTAGARIRKMPSMIACISMQLGRLRRQRYSPVSTAPTMPGTRSRAENP